MHILLIHQAFAALGEPGGTRHHEFARFLVEQGHQVTVLTGQVSYLTGDQTSNVRWVNRETDDMGVSIWHCYTYPGWHRSFVHRVLSFLSFMVSSFLIGLKVRNVDLVWGTSPPIFQGFTAWLLSRLKGAAFLFEVRDLWPLFAIEVGVLKSKVLIRLSEWLERFLYRHSDRVVINSPGYRGHVLARGAEVVDLVPNGVDVEMFTDVKDSRFRQQHGFTNQFLVLYAGAHGMSNDLRVVLEAAQKLREHPEIFFVFIGDGKEKGNLRDWANSHDLQNVRFLPSIAKADIPDALVGSDACLAILKPLDAYKTTYPNKVFDYMAAGRPVLLAIDGVIREVVEKANAGLFIPPGNPDALATGILELADDPQQARLMGASGQDYVAKNFNRSLLANLMLQSMLAAMQKGMPG
jgi:glycosyltransferase involved in cell wall biosynthesis